MAQAQWTSVEQAKAYIATCEKSKVKGLKYCTAIDFVMNHGKIKCSRCGLYHDPDNMISAKDENGYAIALCKECQQRVLAKQATA